MLHCRLEAFYPPQALQSVIAKLDRVDFKSLAAKWNMVSHCF